MKQTNKNLHVPAFGYSWFVFTFQSVLEKEDKDAKKNIYIFKPITRTRTDNNMQTNTKGKTISYEHNIENERLDWFI